MKSFSDDIADHAAGRLTDQVTDIGRLQQRLIDGGLPLPELMRQVMQRIEHSDRPEVWICRVPESAVLARAQALAAQLAQQGAAILESLPLFGVPFAVKDNIDVAGLPTTAACPAFAYVPKASAHVVSKLEAAGAILIGKTNLDQFATGLVGTRSPYGAVRNAVDPAYVSGGSSSGSAVAVALGLVSFSLGTDTAGSGRVPAGFNGIVGLKPTRGLVSTRGVFPACRTLDCVSVFAASVGDAWRVLRCAAGHDADDPYSRELGREISVPQTKTGGWRIAIPDAPEFFGDEAAHAAFDAALAQWARLPGCEITPIPFAPFAEAARLLYAGPWVAERRAAIGEFFDRHADAMDLTVRAIVAQADRYSAVDAFQGMYRLAALRREAERLLHGMDFLLVPTTPTLPTLAAVAQAPIERNSELGTYTNFVNFFDMAALAIPAAPRADGLPAGVTLIGPAGADQQLAMAAQAFDRVSDLARAPDFCAAVHPLTASEPRVALAVVGAHLEGQPLNVQLTERGATKRLLTRTAPEYRLHALAGTTPPKPGLARVPGGGEAIEVEVWDMPLRHFGSFVAAIPAPLGIGTVRLADGSTVKGFLCEPCALADAQDITRFGGWRAYLAAQAAASTGQTHRSMTLTNEGMTS